eukprot:gene5091-125_t
MAESPQLNFLPEFLRTTLGGVSKIFRFGGQEDGARRFELDSIDKLLEHKLVRGIQVQPELFCQLMSTFAQEVDLLLATDANSIGSDDCYPALIDKHITFLDTIGLLVKGHCGLPSQCPQLLYSRIEVHCAHPCDALAAAAGLGPLDYRPCPCALACFPTGNPEMVHDFLRLDGLEAVASLANYTLPMTLVDAALALLVDLCSSFPCLHGHTDVLADVVMGNKSHAMAWIHCLLAVVDCLDRMTGPHPTNAKSDADIDCRSAARTFRVQLACRGLLRSLVWSIGQGDTCQAAACADPHAGVDWASVHGSDAAGSGGQVPEVPSSAPLTGGDPVCPRAPSGTTDNSTGSAEGPGNLQHTGSTANSTHSAGTHEGDYHVSTSPSPNCDALSTLSPLETHGESVHDATLQSVWPPVDKQESPTPTCTVSSASFSAGPSSSAHHTAGPQSKSRLSGSTRQCPSTTADPHATRGPFGFPQLEGVDPGYTTVVELLCLGALLPDSDLNKGHVVALLEQDRAEILPALCRAFMVVALSAGHQTATVLQQLVVVDTAEAGPARQRFPRVSSTLTAGSQKSSASPGRPLRESASADPHEVLPSFDLLKFAADWANCGGAVWKDFVSSRMPLPSDKDIQYGGAGRMGVGVQSRETWSSYSGSDPPSASHHSSLPHSMSLSSLNIAPSFTCLPYMHRFAPVAPQSHSTGSQASGGHQPNLTASPLAADPLMPLQQWHHAVGLVDFLFELCCSGSFSEERKRLGKTGTGEPPLAFAEPAPTGTAACSAPISDLKFSSRLVRVFFWRSALTNIAMKVLLELPFVLSPMAHSCTCHSSDKQSAKSHLSVANANPVNAVPGPCVYCAAEAFIIDSHYILVLNMIHMVAANVKNSSALVSAQAIPRLVCFLGGHVPVSGGEPSSTVLPANHPNRHLVSHLLTLLVQTSISHDSMALLFPLLRNCMPMRMELQLPSSGSKKSKKRLKPTVKRSASTSRSPSSMRLGYTDTHLSAQAPSSPTARTVQPYHRDEPDHHLLSHPIAPTASESLERTRSIESTSAAPSVGTASSRYSHRAPSNLSEYSQGHLSEYSCRSALRTPSVCSTLSSQSSHVPSLAPELPPSRDFPSHASTSASLLSLCENEQAAGLLSILYYVVRDMYPSNLLTLDGFDSYITLGPFYRFPHSKLGSTFLPSPVAYHVCTQYMTPSPKLHFLFAFLKMNLDCDMDVPKFMTYHVCKAPFDGHVAPALYACAFLTCFECCMLITAGEPYSLVHEEVLRDSPLPGYGWHQFVCVHGRDTFSVCVDGQLVQNFRFSYFPKAPRDQGLNVYVGCLSPPPIQEDWQVNYEVVKLHKTLFCAIGTVYLLEGCLALPDIVRWWLQPPEYRDFLALHLPLKQLIVVHPTRHSAFDSKKSSVGLHDAKVCPAPSRLPKACLAVPEQASYISLAHLPMSTGSLSMKAADETYLSACSSNSSDNSSQVAFSRPPSRHKWSRSSQQQPLVVVKGGFFMLQGQHAIKALGESNALDACLHAVASWSTPFENQLLDKLRSAVLGMIGCMLVRSKSFSLYFDTIHGFSILFNIFSASPLSVNTLK